MSKRRIPEQRKTGAPKYNTAEFKRLTGYSEKTLYRLIKERHIRMQPFRGRWSEEQYQDVLLYQKSVEQGRPSGPARINQTFPVRPPVLKALSKLKDAGKYANRGAALEHTILHAHVCGEFKPGSHNLVVDEQGAVSEVDLSDL